ncbi:MAG: hypothetical protein WDM87_08560 [Terracidiphilus sp.]
MAPGSWGRDEEGSGDESNDDESGDEKLGVSGAERVVEELVVGVENAAGGEEDGGDGEAGISEPWVGARLGCGGVVSTLSESEAADSERMGQPDGGRTTNRGWRVRD